MNMAKQPENNDEHYDLGEDSTAQLPGDQPGQASARRTFQNLCDVQPTH